MENVREVFETRSARVGAVRRKDMIVGAIGVSGGAELISEIREGGRRLFEVILLGEVYFERR